MNLDIEKDTGLSVQDTEPRYRIEKDTGLSVIRPQYKT